MGDLDIGIGRGIDIKRLARRARVKITDPDETPDCYIVSRRLQDILRDEHGVQGTEVREYRPRQGYTHYALYIPAGVVGRNPVVVDASFDQFNSEHPSTVNLGSDAPAVVVADPAASYVFADP